MAAQKNLVGVDYASFRAKYGRDPAAFENPEDEGYNPNPQLGDRHYPFHSSDEETRALTDTLGSVAPLFVGGGGAAKLFKPIKDMLAKPFKTALKGIGWGGIGKQIAKFQDEIKEVISDLFDVVKDWDTIDELKELVFGNFVKEIEKGINKKIKDDPELEWMPKIKLRSNSIDDILHDVGEWSAKVANNATSRKVGKRVEIFSTFYPPDNIADELEHFLVDEFNSATQLKISGIIGNENIKEELLEAIQQRFGDAIMEVIAKQKAKLVDKLADHEIYGTQKHVRLQVINGIIDEVIATLLKTSVVGKYYDGKAYLAKHYRKIKNRGYQKKFREKHKENRRWVRIDTGISETAEGDPQKDLEVYQGWIP